MSDAAAGLKRAAAEAALALVRPGMKLGLGTGSTAAEFVTVLGREVAGGLDVTCAATSEVTARSAAALGIRLADLDGLAPLDLTVDGADEIGPGLALIKGGGGALLREKIVATASARMVVIADASKHVDLLGAFPLPVEIVRFASATTMRAIGAALEDAGIVAVLALRHTASGAPFVTDGGNYVVDCACGGIDDPAAIARILADTAGVVEHGLFVGIAHTAFVAGEEGVKTLTA